MKNVLHYLIVFLATGSVFMATAQPCLNNWKYRVPVVIDNSAGTALNDFQAKFVFNSQSLVVAGKAKADGGDIRILDKTGNNLNFWIENGTYNKPSTTVWVKLNTVAATSIDTIYLFYGNSKANNVSSGQTTFDFFDDFTGSFIDPVKWDKCGGGTITVAGGEATLLSNNGSSNAVITTKSTFTSPFVTEAYTNAVSGGIGFIGQVNASDSGWAMAFERLGTGNKVLRMIGIRDSASSLSCVKHIDQLPNPNTEVAGATTGIWKFAWFKDDTAQVKWPGGNVNRIDTLLKNVFYQPKKAILGNILNPGSISFDWFRIRKHTDVEPILALHQEVEIVTTVEIQSNAPLCEQDSLKFIAPFYTGATYTWSGPNAFSSNSQNPVIANATSAASGEYILSVALPNGCSPVIGRINVVVSDSSSVGTISGATTVCADTNAGTISITNQTGMVTGWQSGATPSGPWTKLTTLDTFLSYNNLQSTTYYQIMVQNGVCPADTGTPAMVQVDQISSGGNLLGNAEVCKNYNQGSINLLNSRGTVTRWQVSTDTGNTWSNILNSTLTHSYSNLANDSWFRVETKNGVCPADTSDTVLINTFDLPTVLFSNDTVCVGAITQFSDSTRLADSQKSSWLWSFEPGKGSVLQHPNYQFLQAGTFPVKLKVWSNKGCLDSATQNVVVNPKPTAVFSHNDVCDTIPVQFTNTSAVSSGSIAQYRWVFGDGDTANSRDTNHYYPAEGAYKTQLLVTTDKGCSDSVSKTVNIWPRTQLNFDADSACLGEAITFYNRSMSNANSVAYNWTFGDGNSSTLSQPAHTYAQVDTFEVILQSTTNKGCIDFTSDTVVIYALPQVTFTFSNACNYDSVRFTNNTSIAYGNNSYWWDLGDGAFSSDTNPVHLYPVANRYKVSLYATSDNGCKGDTTQWVETYSIPTANFEFKNICDSIAMPFTNTSSIAAGKLTHFWRFGDGDTSVEKDPKHRYPTHGLYTVYLETTSNFNCKDSLTKIVQVYPRPVPSFTSDSVCFGSKTSFVNTSTIDTGKIDEFEWRYGDGQTSINRQDPYMFLNHGMHQVNLRAVSDKNCVRDTTLPVWVHEVPLPNFSVEDVCFKSEIEPKNLSTIGAGSMSYQWRFGDGNTDTTENPKHQYEKSGIYEIELVAESLAGCKDSLKKFVETYKLPFVSAGEDKTTSKGFEIELTALSDSGVYEWTPAISLNDNGLLRPKANPDDTTLYTLLVTDKHGCQSSDSVRVNIIPDYKLIIYNIITPDNNGENDVWYIDNAETYPDLNLSVFDRSGREVYQTKGYDNTWAGTWNNDPLPDGTYYYVITFDNSDRKYKGSLTILRNL